MAADLFEGEKRKSVESLNECQSEVAKVRLGKTFGKNLKRKIFCEKVYDNKCKTCFTTQLQPFDQIELLSDGLNLPLPQQFSRDLIVYTDFFLDWNSLYWFYLKGNCAEIFVSIKCNNNHKIKIHSEIIDWITSCYYYLFWI